MLKPTHNPDFASAILATPKKRERPANSGQDEIHCTLCDCSEFRRSRIVTICTCGHHVEDHEGPDSTHNQGSRF